MIYNPKISKCDFDPTNQSVSFILGKSSGKKNKNNRFGWPPNGKRFGKTIF